MLNFDLLELLLSFQKGLKGGANGGGDGLRRIELGLGWGKCRVEVWRLGILERGLCVGRLLPVLCFG